MALFGSFRKPAAAPGPPPPAAAPAGAPPSERRSAERHQTAVLNCPLGEIRDLSATGMCLTARAAPPIPLGMLFEFDLQSPADTLTVVGRIVRLDRIKPAGRGLPGGFNIGIQFLRMTPELTAAVESLARHGCLKRKRPSAAGAPAGMNASVQIPDLYATLGVEPAASDSVIQHAFRELARTLHPDVNKTPEANVKFVALLKAYEVLKDADKRSSYDAARIKAAA